MDPHQPWKTHAAVGFGVPRSGNTRAYPKLNSFILIFFLSFFSSKTSRY